MIGLKCQSEARPVWIRAHGGYAAQLLTQIRKCSWMSGNKTKLPARLNAKQTAWVLNLQPHDIPVLVAAKLLKRLDNPQPNSVKYFAALEVLEQANERPR